MKNLYLILTAILFVSCGDLEKLEYRYVDFVVERKEALPNRIQSLDYFLISKDMYWKCPLKIMLLMK